MTPDQVQQATDSLTTAVNTAAQTSGQQIDTSMGQLAPSLQTGTNAPGGYNYQANIAPAIAPLTTAMVTASKQAVLKQAIKDAKYVAQTRYDDANYGLKDRQREYTKRKALEAAARQAKYDAQADAQYARSMSSGGGGGGGGGGGAAGSSVGGVSAAGTAGRPSMVPKNGVNGKAGYAFTDANGRPISALTYAKQVGVSFAALTSKMAQSGDAGAAAIQRSSNTAAYANAYRALTW